MLEVLGLDRVHGSGWWNALNGRCVRSFQNYIFEGQDLSNSNGCYSYVNFRTWLLNCSALIFRVSGLKWANQFLGLPHVLADPLHFDLLHDLVVTTDDYVNMLGFFALLQNNIVEPMRFKLKGVNHLSNLSSCDVAKEWERIQEILLFELRLLLFSFQYFLEVLLIKRCQVDWAQTFNGSRPRRPIQQG